MQKKRKILGSNQLCVMSSEENKTINPFLCFFQNAPTEDDLIGSDRNFGVCEEETAFNKEMRKKRRKKRRRRSNT